MSPELWVLGPLMGAALIAAIGLWFTRGLVRVSPALILRSWRSVRLFTTLPTTLQAVRGASTTVRTNSTDRQLLSVCS